MRSGFTLILALLAVLWGSLALGQVVDDRYTLRATHEAAPAGSQVSVQVLYDGQVGTNGSLPVGLRRWAFGLCHDPQVLGVFGAAEGAATVAVDPDFSVIHVNPPGITGLGFGVVVDHFGVNMLAPGLGLELYVVTYDLEDFDFGVTSLDFCSNWGDPPLETHFEIAGVVEVIPMQLSGSVTVGEPEPEFIRGECNDDGSFDLSDPIFLLSYLFPQQGVPPGLSCVDACDANNDGSVDLADVTAGLAALFGTPAIPLPGSGGCEEDTGSDPHGCDMYGGC